MKICGECKNFGFGNFGLKILDLKNIPSHTHAFLFSKFNALSQIILVFQNLCFSKNGESLPERVVVLDQLDLAIRANFKSRGWLPLLEIDHPPPTALIRKFYSNLSCHVYDSNTLVRSWIRDVEFTITPRVVAEALRVLVVRDVDYPYDESPSLDVVMSYITRSSIQWGTDPQIMSAELAETAYLFFRIACHSLWPISHFHTIPLE